MANAVGILPEGLWEAYRKPTAVLQGYRWSLGARQRGSPGITGGLLEAPWWPWLAYTVLLLLFETAPGRLSVYFAKARASAFLQDTFCEPTKLSTATAMARSMPLELQYSERRILAKDSDIRRILSK